MKNPDPCRRGEDVPCQSCGLTVTVGSMERCVCGALPPDRIIDDVYYWDFCYCYEHDGLEFSLFLRATSWEDAERRLDSITRTITLYGKLGEATYGDYQGPVGRESNTGTWRIIERQ